MPKILIITPSFFPATYYGGPIFSLYNLARCLARHNFTVFVSTTNTNGKKKLEVVTDKFLQLETDLYVKYYSGGTESGFSLKMFLMLWKDIKGKNLLYLVSIFSPSTPLVILLNFFFNKPLILSPRGQLGEWCLKQGNIFKKLWLKVFISPFANNIIWDATSFSEKEMIRKVYSKARVEVIPPIIDVNQFEVRNSKKDSAIYEKMTGKDLSDKKIIVSMGRLHKVKGFDILIEAVSRVQRDDVVLLIAGEDFGEKKNLEMLIDKLELKEKVFLVGNIEGSDKIEFLKNADLFALASHHENFGIVYAEALASGIPIIASQNTPWEDVEKYDCGKWVVNKAEDFARAINNILQEDLKKMGENGRKYITDNFSWDKIAHSFNEIVKPICSPEHFLQKK